MFNNIVTLPMIFSSATFYSLSAAPAWIKTIGYAFPFSYLIDGEHAAFAANAAGAFFPSLILLAFTALSLVLAVATFRWDPNTPIIRRNPTRIHRTCPSHRLVQHSHHRYPQPTAFTHPPPALGRSHRLDSHPSPFPQNKTSHTQPLCLISLCSRHRETSLRRLQSRVDRRPPAETAYLA